MSKKFKSYVLTQDFKAAYVVATGHPKQPQKILTKNFKKGDIVNGVMHYDGTKPAFVMVGDTLVMPLEILQEVITKKIAPATSNADGKTAEDSVKTVVDESPRLRYMDMMLLGALLGGATVYLAETKGWISNPNPKNKMYGAIGGALLLGYLVYRKNNMSKKVTVKVK